MGYAIFTARKLMLTNRLSQLNFRIMQLSQQQQTLSQAAGDFQRAMSAQKAYFNNLGNQQMNIFMGMLQNGQLNANGNNTTENNIFQQIQEQIQKTYMTNSYFDFMSQARMQNIKNIEDQIEQERETLQTQVKAVENELKTVQEGEDKALERSAPKFA